MIQTEYRQRHFAEKGFSLVEIMVVLLISSVLIGGTLVLLAKTQGSRVTQEMYSQVQENGRISLEWISHDLRMAGNRVLTYPLSSLVKTSVVGLQPTVTGNCFTTSSQALDWALALLPTSSGERTPAVMGENNLTVSGPSVFSGCIGAADVQIGSDIISIHYIDPTPVAAASLQAEHLFVSSGIGKAVLFQCPININGVSCAALLTDKREDPSGVGYYRLISRAYYVRNWSVTSGDGMPTLVRVDLQNGGGVTTETLMEGLRSLQVRFGIDTDDDGFADQFKTAGQMPALSSEAGLATSWSKIKSVKVDVLAQSVDVDLRLGNGNQTQTIAGETITLPQKYLSRLFSTTVTMRNTRMQGG